MEDLAIQPEPETNKKTDFVSTLASEILMKIFGYLQLDDVMKLSLVCKRWDSVSSSDALWGKFVPKYPDVDLPKAKSQKEIFQKLWSDSVQIGKERWFPNPLPGLVEHNTLLQTYNEQRSSATKHDVFSFSKCMLYLRLNPLYPFTTDGIKCEDPLMQEIVRKISDKLGDIPRPGYEGDEKANVPDGTSLVNGAFLTDRQNVMRIIVVFCYDYVTNNNSMASYWDLPIDEEGHSLEKHLNDNEKVGIVSLLPSEEEISLNKRLFNQVRNVVVDKNPTLMVYYVPSRYRNETESEDLLYSRQFIVSDTAVVYCARRDIEGEWSDDDDNDDV